MFRVDKNARLASMALCDSHSYSLALTATLWHTLALSGSYWISPCLSMALCDFHSGSHCHSLAYSGPFWLTIALLFRVYSPCSTLNAAATLTHFLPL